MDKWLFLIVILCFLFVLTYDPKSRGLENFVPSPPSTLCQAPSGCCNQNKYMADHPTQCERAHYQGVQFANPNYGCPPKIPEAELGAIVKAGCGITM